MSAYELYIPPERITVNPKNGQFLKGHEPHNKGKSWKEWMPKEHQMRILANLDKGRGNMNLPGWNRKAVVAIDADGKFRVFPSAMCAGRILGICARNIRSVCNRKRKHAGEMRFFFEEDAEWVKHIKQ